MKRLWALLLAALAIPLAAPVAAEEAVATHIADDAVGDVRIMVQGNPTTPPADAFAPVDLKALDVVERPDDFVFTLSVASLTPQAEGPIEGSTTYFVHFLQNDRLYRMRITRQVFLDANYFGRLDGFDPGRGGYFTVTPLEVTVDTSAHTLQVAVPRHQMVDSDGAAPHPETPITGFRVSAVGLTSGRSPRLGVTAVPVAVTDAMPDAGNATTVLNVAFGARSSGHVRLSSETPTRASNGEATTFVFQVKAENLGTAEDTFTLATSGPPRGWSVRLPANQVTIPGNGSVLLPIVVATPFAHEHGTYQHFTFEMASVTDRDTVGRVQLGVRYAQPPQPAGHHPQLWFHSQANADDPVTQNLLAAFGDAAEVYMNAALDDPTDQGVEVQAHHEGTTAGTGPPQQLYQWEVPLAPGLEMGLDFDLSGRGQLQANVRSTGPLPDASLSGYLVHYAPPEGNQEGFGFGAQGAATILADLAPTAPAPLDGTVTLTTEIVPRPAADFIPFAKGASLLLVLNLTTARPDAPFGTGHAAPVLAPGSTLTLPLFEYHDPVDDIFLSDIELVVGSRPDRLAGPGQTILFNLTLRNNGASAGTYLIDLLGTNVGWARLLPAATTVDVPAGGSHEFFVIVQVPADVRVPEDSAAERPAADLIVSVANQADYNQRALARLYTAVAKGNHPDDAGLVAKLEARHGEDQGSPGAAAFAVLVALGAAAMLASRRR